MPRRGLKDWRAVTTRAASCRSSSAGGPVGVAPGVVVAPLSNTAVEVEEAEAETPTDGLA